MELLLRRTGVEVAHIPYRGAAPAMISQNPRTRHKILLTAMARRPRFE
jgi:hypothetical protein